MTKDWWNELPADEQRAAQELLAISADMHMPGEFQGRLESQLMDAYNSKQKSTKGQTNRFTTLGWVVAALAVFVLFIWDSQLQPMQPAPFLTAAPQIPFDEQVQQGAVCTGTLALAHGFDVSLSNADKTAFVPLDDSHAIGELRAFDWSPDGHTLAVVGNTTGSGNIYLTDSSGTTLTPILASGELGYLMDANWSKDGQQLVTWSLQNNRKIDLVNVDGTMSNIDLGLYLNSTPQFGRADQSLFFIGSNETAFGLFEFNLSDAQLHLISGQVEDESGFAVSPDGKKVAFVEMDRVAGRMRLIVLDLETETRTIISELSIPTGSGSALPEVANLIWNAERTSLTFDFGRSQSDRVIYEAQLKGSELTALVEGGRAASTSTDGKCLAYINDEKQVELLNLSDPNLTPVLTIDLPGPRAITDYRLDALGWSK